MRQFVHIYFLSSDLCELFSHNILLLQQSGILRRIFTRWNMTVRATPANAGSVRGGGVREPFPLGGYHVACVGLVLLAGIVAALLVAMVEFMLMKAKQ